MRRIIALPLALLLGAGLALVGAAPANAQTGNFQDNNSPTGTFSTTSTTNEIVGQTFVAQATGTLKSVTVWVGGNSNGGYMNLTADNVTGGFPNGSDPHTGGILLGSASTSEQVFYLSGGGLPVVAGQTYSFEWYAYGGTKLVSTTSGNAYSGGSMFTGIDNTFPQGYQAAYSGQDFRFVTSIDSTTVTNPTVTGTPTDGAIGSAYSFSYSLGGTPVASKVSHIAGALPPGLSISNSGVISGTPTAAGTYSFTVQVDNGAYATISSSITVLNAVPDAPTGVSASAGYKQATVSFTAPAYAGTSPITSFTVTSTSDASTCTATAPATSCIVTGLTAGALYRFTVTATNSAGAGATSGQSTLIQPYSEPGAPSPVWSSAANGQVTVNWGPALNNGGSVSSYTVTLSPGGQSATVGLGTYAVTFSGLTNGTAYTPSVTATSNRGTGPANVGAAVTPGMLAGPPTSFSASGGNESVVLSWAAPSDDGGFAITGYKLLYRADSADPYTSLALGVQYTHTLTDLAPGATYEFELAAVTGYGTGIGSYASASAMPYGKPAAPTSVSAASADQQLTVSWSEPYDSGAAITGYAVRYKATSAAIWLTGPTTASTSAVITGLINGTSYDVQVVATNSAGDGPWSATVVGTPSTVAGAPQALAATAGDESLALTWASPADLGGSAFITYFVQYRSDFIYTNLYTASPSLSLSGLDNSTFYEVRVGTITSAGLGAWSTIYSTPYVFEPEFTDAAGAPLAGTTVGIGTAVTVMGVDALPGQTVTVELHSAPIVLGSTVVAPDGTFLLTVTIPAEAEGGAHSLVASMGSGGGDVASIAIQVLRPAALASTGVEPAVPIVIVVLLLLVGGFLFWRSRRAARAPR